MKKILKFSILGMNLFGCKFCEINEKGENVCDRKNFDSLLWSLVTVFQVRAILNNFFNLKKNTQKKSLKFFFSYTQKVERHVKINYLLLPGELINDDEFNY